MAAAVTYGEYSGYTNGYAHSAYTQHHQQHTGYTQHQHPNQESWSTKYSALNPKHISCCRKRFVVRICKGGLTVVLLLTIMINISFIIDTSRRIQQARAVQNHMSADDTDRKEEVLHIEGRSIKQVTEPPRTIELGVYSSKNRVFMSVDGAMIYEDREKEKNRGIHVLVLNQATGSIMAERVFDTYVAKEDEAMTLFLSMLAAGRIILMAAKDEASLQLKQPSRDMLMRLGSTHAHMIGWRDMWAMVAVKGEGRLAEEYSKAADIHTWGHAVTVKTHFTLRPLRQAECDWPDSETSTRRRRFCSKFEGYGSVCSCKEPAPLTFHTLPLEEDNISDIPVTVIASNRPHYLYRMLRSVLSAHGVNPSMITVFIDGYYEGPLEVARLFGINAVQHTPLGVKNARISQHYRASLTATFSLFPKAQFTILLEEDLDVSPDIFSYFSQLVPVFQEDESLYCISAWNDQGYEHSCKDPELLYRVETMPGLGWMLKRSLFKEELEANWPTSEKQWDWDMWMRLPSVRRGRECIVPDVSRTYHFGTKGVNMNSYFQDTYFKKHTLNILPHVKLKDPESVAKDAYEEHIGSLVQTAQVLDHSQNPCTDNFIPDTSDKIYVLYITMQQEDDDSTWKPLAKCWGLWDLDVRGVHKSMWRFFLKSNHILVIGSPASPYSQYKPAEINPIILDSEEESE